MSGAQHWRVFLLLFDLLVALLTAQILHETSSCPPDGNYSEYIGVQCSQESLQCSYGTEACCGKVHSSVLCDCSSSQFECMATEACMAPCEVSDGVNQTGLLPTMLTASSKGSTPVVTVDTKKSVNIELDHLWQVGGFDLQQADERALVFAGTGLCNLVVGPAIQVMVADAWCVNEELSSSPESEQACLRGCTNECALDRACIAVDLQNGQCRKFVGQNRTIGDVWIQVDTKAESSLCFLSMNASDLQPLSSCSQCEASGYQADFCQCGVCGSFGHCSYSCGKGNEEYRGAMLGPRCSPQQKEPSGTPSEQHFLPKVKSPPLRSQKHDSTKIPWILLATVGSGLFLLLFVLLLGASVKFHRRQLWSADPSMDVPLQELGGDGDAEEQQNVSSLGPVSRRIRYFLNHSFLLLAHIRLTGMPYVPGTYPPVTVQDLQAEFQNVAG